MDPIIVEKIRAMEVIGVRSVAEVRRHLNSFVKDELFHGEEPPPELSRRYYPTDADIRNILYTSRIGARKAPDDQINLEIKCKDWQESNPEDFIFYRVKYVHHCTFNE
jgi:hedgehog interacting protein